MFVTVAQVDTLLGLVIVSIMSNYQNLSDSFFHVMDGISLGNVYKYMA